MFGEEGQNKIEAQKVAVVGAGGLGSQICQALAYTGVRSIGVIDDDRLDETNMNRVAGAFPPDIAPAYSSTPFAWNTQYFILKGGALTAEGYTTGDVTTPTGELLSVTGGIRSFSGASGFIVEAPFGTNATGCPNFRATFRLRSGRGRD